MSYTVPDPGPPNPFFEEPADPARLEQTVGALEQRGFSARLAKDSAHARELLLGTLQEGAEVYAAPSQTLEALGVTSVIDESGRFDSVRGRLKLMDREAQSREIRRLRAAPDVILGSAHAITDEGEIIVASGTGRQLGAYAFAARMVILAVGHQKLVHDIAEGLRRIREYSLPREHLRLRAAGSPGSLWSETLILHHDPAKRVRILLIPETLGF